ncbi:tetratricopeptide repeat protein [Bernardetia sp. MNP-M8]|uniref:tetratricopeptide repeat protein n=1 Tax=Bernardetia sp. MNP-M8 TaxID=3127470 RepID=UPI0030D37886
MKNPLLIHFTLFSVFLLYPILSFGQNPIVVDSLQHIYGTASHDTTRILALDGLVSEYMSKKLDSAEFFAEKSIQLSKKIKNNSFKGLALNTLGYVFYKKREFDKALTYFHEALEIREKLKNETDIIVTSNHIAFIHFYRGEYSTTFEYFQKSLMYAEKINDLKTISSLLNNMGTVLQNQSDFPNALEYFFRSLKIKEEMGDLKSIAFTHSSISTIYHDLGNADKSLEYAFKSLKIYEEINDLRGIGRVLSTLAGTYNQQEKYNEALEYYIKSLEAYQKIDYEKGITSSILNIAIVNKNLNNFDESMKYFKIAKKNNETLNDKVTSIFINEGLANLYLKKQLYDSAITHAQEAFAIAKETGMQDRLKKISDILYEANKQSKNYSEALLYYETANAINDSLFNIEKAKVISNLTSTIDLERKEKELALVEKDNELNQILAEKKEQELEIVKKQAEAEHLFALAMQEKDKRKADSLFNLAQQSKMEAKNLQIQAENLQIQKEKQSLAFKAEREEQKRIQYTYLVIAGTFFIVLILIGIGLRQKQKANKQLALQNNEIKMQQTEIAQKNQFLNQANEELQQQHEELVVLHENLETQKQTVENTYTQLKTTTEQLDKSIHYASHIQSVVMPENADLNLFFSELFVLFRPRDVVSGDFYWFSQISENQAIFSLADCTGHGVPGAFMSMLGATLLHETINIKKITNDPARILKNIHEAIRKILKQEQDKNNDGMDISLCVFTKKPKEKTVELLFSGAKSSMSYVTNGQIHHIKGDRQYLGGKKLKEDFTNQQFILPIDTTFYLYTDGYPDQNSVDRKKIGSGVFREILLDNSNKNFDTQLKTLELFLDEHQGVAEQRDDISVIGIKI